MTKCICNIKKTPVISFINIRDETTVLSNDKMKIKGGIAYYYICCIFPTSS